jgi:hypothetical protein
VAIGQAEQRMMGTFLEEVRSWVHFHAKDCILNYFNAMKARREDNYHRHVAAITEHAHYYGARPNPHELAAADAQLKKCIDDDWKASVQRYPEVLEYYYSLVQLALPDDRDPAIRDPPLSALAGVNRRPQRPLTDVDKGMGGRSIRPPRAEPASHAPMGYATYGR